MLGEALRQGHARRQRKLRGGSKSSSATISLWIIIVCILPQGTLARGIPISCQVSVVAGNSCDLRSSRMLHISSLIVGPPPPTLTRQTALLGVYLTGNSWLKRCSPLRTIAKSISFERTTSPVPVISRCHARTSAHRHQMYVQYRNTLLELDPQST